MSPKVYNSPTHVTTTETIDMTKVVGKGSVFGTSGSVIIVGCCVGDRDASSR